MKPRTYHMLYFIHMVVGGWPVSHLHMVVSSPAERLATDLFVSEAIPSTTVRQQSHQSLA